MSTPASIRRHSFITAQVQRFREHRNPLALVLTVAGGSLRFARRLRHRLAGFTAAARLSGEYYFGTGFSGRPNYIETMDGAKYFFPRKANRLFVAAFKVYFGRYLASINTELDVVAGRKALSIFDTFERRFIYCDYWIPAAAERVRRVSRAA